MIDVDHWLLGRETEIRMLLQVHDELVFEVREDCVGQYREEIASRMSAGGAHGYELLKPAGKYLLRRR
jgi:DNA polymerase-1